MTSTFLTPEMIAAAWAAWKPRHPARLGPGPGFVEALQAALDAAPPVQMAPPSLEIQQVLDIITEYGLDAQPGSEYRLATDDLLEKFREYLPQESV